MSVMTRNPRKHPAGQIVIVGLVLMFVGALLLPSIALRWSGGTGLLDPITWVRSGGFASWGSTETGVAAIIVLVAVAAMTLIGLPSVLAYMRGTPIDVAGKYLAHGKKMGRLHPREVRKRNKRMGCTDMPGIAFGYAVAGGTPIRGTYEESCVVIAGPRRQKTRTVVIPNVLYAPGSVLVTSVRPDIIKNTIEHRSQVGDVWVFDPQELAGAYGEHRAWWNPLAGITTFDEAKALARTFADAAYKGEASGGNEVFFREQGIDLLGSYLLAAKTAGHHLPKVAEWMQDDHNDEPAKILEEEHPSIAEAILATQDLVPQTRSGVFANARGSISFLASAQMREWVTPRTDRPGLDPAAFVNAPRDTLYLLSAEDGEAGPLVAALTKAVTRVAEQDAARREAGRREVPFVLVLDEAANICRIKDLPAKYSHWGGAGIIPISIFQSFEQGAEVWGENAFTQLWNAATIRLFGGGNASARFLQELVAMIGEYEYTEQSKSRSQGKTSTNTTKHTEPIIGVDELPALPEGRMIVFPSGVKPILARMVGFDRDKTLQRTLAKQGANA